MLRLLCCDCIATKHNGRIRDLVGAAAVLAPREDRHVSSPNQIAFAGILQRSPALAPVGYGYLLLHHGFSFGCSYTQETFQPTTEASSFTSFMPVFPMGFSRAIRLTSLRKVRDSNPRAISDSRVSGAVLSTSQPTFLLRLLRHDCIVVSFFVFNSPFSFPSRIILLILCFG